MDDGRTEGTKLPVPFDGGAAGGSAGKGSPGGGSSAGGNAGKGSPGGGSSAGGSAGKGSAGSGSSAGGNAGKGGPDGGRQAGREDKDAANAAAVLRFHNDAAYEHYESSPYLRERNEILVGVLPGDVRTVLDVGSGPGIVGRALEATGRFVVSTDLSRAALAAGPPRPYLASASDLPHSNRAFDLVLSLEMLEHIPDEVLEPIAGEMSRVAKRWVLVGVPHRENLARNHLLCPRCGFRFNRTGHVQSFDQHRLAGLFPEFVPRWSRICGPPVRDYPAPLLGLRHGLARRFSEMSGQGANVCPRCGETEFAPFRHNLLSFALDGVNKVVSRRRPYWILALLERS